MEKDPQTSGGLIFRFAGVAMVSRFNCVHFFFHVTEDWLVFARLLEPTQLLYNQVFCRVKKAIGLVLGYPREADLVMVWDWCIQP